MRKSKSHVLAVVGAQYGSEGKGVIVNYLANRYHVHVRTGGPNAGHSFIHKGRVWKMQVIPCGWTNPEAILVLGRGMLVNPEILLRELEAIRGVDPTIDDRLIIDTQAGILDRSFHEEEGGTEGELHQRIGSTGEGVGAARIARIRRDPSRFKLAKDIADEYGLRRYLRENTPKLLQQYLKGGQNILLEGTQGSGLSLIHGPWPYVTSHDTNAAQLAADAGIPPMLVTRVLLVVRTYPIRVAGNSGPLKNELTWEEISRRVGKQVVERTTVTNKVRRIGEWDEELLDNAITLNRPTSIAITFMDYLSPQDEGKTQWGDLSSDTAKRFIRYVESRFRVQVSLIGTGGPNWNIVDRGFAV